MSTPSCPVSFGQPIPGARVFLKGEPWSRPGAVHDLVNQIPRAHDLPSVIHALNQIRNIVMMINRGEPVINNYRGTNLVNNIRIPKEPDEKVPGKDNNPNYQALDWTQGRVESVPQKLINPDDDSQYIELDTIKIVEFYNPNTEYRLNYVSKIA